MLMLKNKWNSFQNWGHIYIGPLSDVSLKHRNSVLFISILMMLISPDVTITFGSASIAGLGIKIEPPQTIHIGSVLFLLLLYRLIAFWATTLISHGTNEKIAYKKAAINIDASYLAPQQQATITDVINEESDSIKYKWETHRIIWEFIVPNALALAALAKYFYYYVLVT